MPWKLTIRLAELFITSILAIALIAAWRADRTDRAQLAAELTTANQSLAQADERQHTRDSQLLQTLATLSADKRQITTPAQIIRELPQYLSLPAPITLQSKSNQSATKPGFSDHSSQGPTGPSPNSTNSPNNSEQTQAVIPAADLKPLYDFALDCKACQAKLTATQGDLTDEKAKTATLTQERDAAIRAAKGGSLLRRLTRAAKWFAIGAAAGAIAARAHH